MADYKNSGFILALLLLSSSLLLAQQELRTERKSSHPKKEILEIIDESIKESVEQYKILMKNVPQDRLPRTYQNGKVLTVGPTGWVSGFYPGTIFTLYQATGDKTLLAEGKRLLPLLEEVKNFNAHHDLGFMMYTSYGKAYELFRKPEHKEILIQSAKSLATRYDPRVGSIESWDKVKSLNGDYILNFPVIIDNLMNLELLFFAAEATGDDYFSNIAIKHAIKTMKNHLRPDFSSYHVVDYDTLTGEVLAQETQQGYSDNSTWSRGQAWGIYGFTMTYRETKDERFLEAAKGMADFYLNHPNMPKDNIPYWDFNVGQEGYDPAWTNPQEYSYIPRDASAAAIVSSALIELSQYVDAETSEKYLNAAAAMLKSLSSKEYRAEVGENAGFILKHGTGGFPGNSEVDVPLSYADYYYVEAMLRYKNLER